MVVVSRPVDDKFEDKLGKLCEEFEALKEKVSALRKAGQDTSIPEVLLLDFNPKVQMARATYDESDLAVLRNLLADIRKEVGEVEHGSEFSHLLELIKDAYDFIRAGQIKEAKAAYNQIMYRYKGLPVDLKRTIYVAALDIRDKIKNG